MSTESFHEAVKFTAPTTGETTAPVVEDNTSAGHEGSEENEPRVFTQEQLDAIVAKEKAKARRQAERELRQASQQNQTPTEAPKPQQFKTQEEYLEAYSDWKADQKIAQRQQQEQRNQVESSFEDQLDSARVKYTDFDTKVKTPGWYCSDAALQAIQESKLGAEIVYHLASNPEESKRIFDMNPVSQIREIGKIEASLATNPPAKKPSSAPAPITPVGSRSASPNYSASDPRSLKLSMDEWAAARAKEKAKSRQG